MIVVPKATAAITGIYTWSHLLSASIRDAKMLKLRLIQVIRYFVMVILGYGYNSILFCLNNLKTKIIYFKCYK